MTPPALSVYAVAVPETMKAAEFHVSHALDIAKMGIEAVVSEGRREKESRGLTIFRVTPPFPPPPPQAYWDS